MHFSRIVSKCRLRTAMSQHIKGEEINALPTGIALFFHTLYIQALGMGVIVLPSLIPPPTLFKINIHTAVILKALSYGL